MKTKELIGSEVAATIEQQIPGAVVESADGCIVVERMSIAAVMRFLKTADDFDFSYLNNLTAVDNLDHFEVIYHLTSFTHKHMLCVKTRVDGRENLEVPSVTSVWQGADFQEREVYDLLGIRFAGHPNLKRIALWDGFEGHPLRKDFL